MGIVSHSENSGFTRDRVSPNETLPDNTASRTTNSGVGSAREGYDPQPLLHVDIENKYVTPTRSELVSTLPARQLRPGTSPESSQPTSEGLTTGRKLFGFFGRGKQQRAASTSFDNSNVVANHFRVGKKLSERSTFISFTGTNLLNNMPVAIMFVCANSSHVLPWLLIIQIRNLVK